MIIDHARSRARPDIRIYTTAVAACTIVAACLVWYRIGTDSFWFDESASIRLADQAGWADMPTIDNGNMPLYLALLKLWRGLGHSEAWVRLLSAIPFVLTVPTVALLGRRLFGKRAAVLAAALVATHPMLVEYGQEARGFSLVTLLVSAAALGLVAGVQDENRPVLVGGIVLLALAPYAHSGAALTGLALLAWMLWIPSGRSPLPWRGAVLIYALVAAPLAITIAGNASDTRFWTTRNYTTAPLAIGWHVVSDTPAALVIAPLTCIGIVLAFQRVRRSGRTVGAWLVGVPAVWTIGTSTLLLIVSLHRSLLVPRYLLLIAPGLALLVAYAATHVRWKRLALALVAGAVVVNAGVVVLRAGEHRPEQWREAQAFIARETEPGDGIAFAPSHKSVLFEHYQVEAGDELPRPVLPAGQWGDLPFAPSDTHPDVPRDVAERADALGESDRVWLVIGNGPAGGPSRDYTRALTDTLESSGEADGQWKFGEVTVRRYVMGR